MKKTVFAALTLACVLLAGCGEQGSNPQPGNAGGTSTQSSAGESTQTSSGESDEQSSVPESTAEQTSNGESNEEKRSDYERYELTFPAHDFGRTEYNAKILDITPFEMTVDLPKEWSVHIPQSKDEYEGGFATVDIMKGDKKIGGIDYNIYPTGKYDENPNDWDEIDETQSYAYRQIYNQIMLGSGVNWDGDYKEVSTKDNTIASTCRIMVKDTPENEYAHGILARNKPLGVYVQIAINDASIPSDTIEYIAKSIELK